jgi:hypothetical protein
VPADRDARRTSRAALPEVVTDATNDVGFLDVADLDPATLAVAIDDAFRSLTVGAVLAVYCVLATAAELDELCERGDLELITAIRHSAGGTTYTICKRRTTSETGTRRPDRR